MAKRILIIGAGIEQIYGYKLAREMSIETVGTDMNPDAPFLNLLMIRLLPVLEMQKRPAKK